MKIRMPTEFETSNLLAYRVEQPLPQKMPIVHAIDISTENIMAILKCKKRLHEKHPVPVIHSSHARFVQIRKQTHSRQKLP